MKYAHICTVYTLCGMLVSKHACNEVAVVPTKARQLRVERDYTRAGTGPCGREMPPVNPGAAVHRHTLDRVNAIKKEITYTVSRDCPISCGIKTLANFA